MLGHNSIGILGRIREFLVLGRSADFSRLNAVPDQRPGRLPIPPHKYELSRLKSALRQGLANAPIRNGRKTDFFEVVVRLSLTPRFSGVRVPREQDPQPLQRFTSRLKNAQKTSLLKELQALFMEWVDCFSGVFNCSFLSSWGFSAESA